MEHSDKNQKYRFETLQVRAGQEIDPVSKGTAVPIYQSTAYTFDDVQDGADLFALKKPGNIYTRITNTTTEVFEKRMAALENGVAAVATASGQSAVFLSVLNICGPGDNIVTSPFLYGGTFTMFEITLRDMGIEVRFAKSDHVDDLVDLIDGRTKAVYLENLGNPAFNVPDYEPIIEMAHRNGICVIVDNTFSCGGYLFRPLEWGADVAVHSATKWICGHGTALGGVVVDGGRFDWTNGRYPLLAFRVKGGFDAAAALVGRLELILHVGSVGDSKSLIVHPASTTHSQLSPEEQVAAGVYPNMLRLSVGIENVDDLIADLEQAL